MIIREEYVNGAIEKLYDGIVGECKKCQNGFLDSNKKLSTLKDLVDSDSIKCDCFKKYEILKSYIISGIPREFWGWKDQDISIDSDSKKKIQTYLKKLSQVCGNGIGILFIGSQEGIKNPNSGVGKTALATKILENILSLKKTAHYITMHSYFNHIYRSKGDREESAFYGTLVDEIEAVDVLCIDEVGKINKTDYVYNRFEDMIRRRSSQLAVTIIITNMNEEELESFVGPSLMDILRHTMVKIMLTGKSYRTKRFLDIKKGIDLEV